MIEYIVLAVFVALFMFLGARGYKNTKQKKISNYGINSLNAMMNPLLWKFEKTHIINSLLTIFFTCLGCLLTPYFFVFAFLIAVIKVDW